MRLASAWTPNTRLALTRRLYERNRRICLSDSSAYSFSSIGTAIQNKYKKMRSILPRLVFVHSRSTSVLFFFTSLLSPTCLFLAGCWNTSNMPGNVPLNPKRFHISASVLFGCSLSYRKPVQLKGMVRLILTASFQSDSDSRGIKLIHENYLYLFTTHLYQLLIRMSPQNVQNEIRN